MSGGGGGEILSWALSTVLQPPAGTARASLPRRGKPGLPLVLKAERSQRLWCQHPLLLTLVSLLAPAKASSLSLACGWPVFPPLWSGSLFQFPAGTDSRREPTVAESFAAWPTRAAAGGGGKSVLSFWPPRARRLRRPSGHPPRG